VGPGGGVKQVFSDLKKSDFCRTTNQQQHNSLFTFLLKVFTDNSIGHSVVDYYLSYCSQYE